MTARTGGADAQGPGLGEEPWVAQAEQHAGVAPEGHQFVTVCRVSCCHWEWAGVIGTRLI